MSVLDAIKRLCFFIDLHCYALCEWNFMLHLEESEIVSMTEMTLVAVWRIRAALERLLLV